MFYHMSLPLQSLPMFYMMVGVLFYLIYFLERPLSWQVGTALIVGTLFITVSTFIANSPLSSEEIQQAIDKSSYPSCVEEQVFLSLNENQPLTKRVFATIKKECSAIQKSKDQLLHLQTAKKL